MEGRVLLCPGTAWKSRGGQDGLPRAGRQAAPGSGRVPAASSSWWNSGAACRYGATRNEAVGRGMFQGRKGTFIVLHPGPPFLAGEQQRSVSRESLVVWLQHPNAAVFIQSFS